MAVVTRAGDEWQAEILDLDASYHATSLARIDVWVRGVLGLPGRAWINYQFHTGDDLLDRLIGEVRTVRRAAQVAEERARQTTRTFLADMARHIDLSTREAAVLLGLSHQRIQQLGPTGPRERWAGTAQPRASTAPTAGAQEH